MIIAVFIVESIDLPHVLIWHDRAQRINIIVNTYLPLYTYNDCLL